MNGTAFTLWTSLLTSTLAFSSTVNASINRPAPGWAATDRTVLADRCFPQSLERIRESLCTRTTAGPVLLAANNDKGHKKGWKKPKRGRPAPLPPEAPLPEYPEEFPVPPPEEGSPPPIEEPKPWLPEPAPSEPDWPPKHPESPEEFAPSPLPEMPRPGDPGPPMEP